MRSLVQQWALAHLPSPVIHWLKKRHYLRLLKDQGPNEEPDFALIAKLVKPGDCVIDVGANYGVFMKFLSELVGDTGIVYCIEPVPGTFEIISSNATNLKLNNVHLMNCAFSDHKADAVMEIPRLPGGGENYYQARIIDDRSDPTLRQVKIKTVTLDSQFASKGRAIDFIKCDVEGHELRCVSGAIQVLRTCRPAWCVEVSGDPDQSGSDSWRLFRLFETEGYESFWFDGRVLKKRRPADKSINYFFLQPSHLPSLGCLLSAGELPEGKGRET